jgi:hypothetical protein
MRVDDWETRLHALLAEREGKPFAWGVHDCFTFGADVVKAIVGFDPMLLHRGQYKTARQARGRLQRHGGIEAFWTQQLGPAVNIVWARRGDLCLVPQSPIPAMTVCTGDLLAAQGPTGITWLPILAATVCWTVD